jgi:hypothetical protein
LTLQAFSANIGCVRIGGPLTRINVELQMI